MCHKTQGQIENPRPDAKKPDGEKPEMTTISFSPKARATEIANSLDTMSIKDLVQKEQ